MDQLFYWMLGISLVLFAICGVFLLIAERTKKKNAEEAFRQAGATLTTRIDDLWMDEDQSLFLVAREGGETPVHSYKDVLGASMSEDGVQYLWKKNRVCAAESGEFWPPEPDARGKYANGNRVSTIYLNIFIKKRECPVETLVLLTRPCNRSSRTYREAAAKASALMRLFNTVNESAETKK